MSLTGISDALSRYKNGKALKWFFIVVALVSCFRLRNLQSHNVEAFDFANVFLGQRMLARGINPYDDSAIKSQWKDIVKTYGLHSKYEPGSPDMPLLYPPWALSMLLWLNGVPYPCACTVWYFLSALFYMAGVYLICKGKDPPTNLRDFIVVAAFLVAVNCTIIAYLIGQPTFCAFMGLCGAFYFSTEKKPVVAGLFLFIASIKITLALPLIVFFIIKRNYKALVTLTVCLIAAMFFFIFLEGQAIACVRDYLSSLQKLRTEVFSLSRTGPYIGVLQSMTEPTAFLALFLKGSVLKAAALLFPLATACTLIAGTVRKRFTDVEILITLYLVLFTSTYVRGSDLAFFLALSLMYCCRRSEKSLLAFCAIISPFFFPLNTALLALRVDLLNPLYFSQPMVIAILTLFFNWILVKKSFETPARV
jgi:hypothetical protein